MKELQVLTNALDVAVKAGVFNLQDTGAILQSINAVGQKLQQFESLNTSLGPEPKEPANESDKDNDLPIKKTKK